MSARLSLKQLFLLILMAVIASYLFTAYNLDLSKKFGRLSTVTNYDDVIYLSKAGDIYFTWKRSGPVEGITLLLTKSLHAPFTVLNALAGYVLFGFDPDRVYFAQIAVLLTYLFFVGWNTRRLNIVFMAAILLASLAIPYAALCVQVFRPDQMGGVVVAGLSVAILTAENLFDRFWKGILIGLGLGLSLMIKSSTFALILIVVPGAWFLTAVRMLSIRKCSIRAVFLSGALALSAAAVLCGWYWIQHGGELWAYFVDNTIGVNADIWRTPGGVREHLLFYFQGVSLQSSLGLFTIPILILYLGGTLSDIALKSKTEERMIGAGLLIMFVGVFVIYFLQGIKNFYMGGVLYMILLFGALYYLEQIILIGAELWNSKPLMLYGCAALLVACSWTLSRFPETERVNSLSAANSKSTTTGIIEDLSKIITSRPTAVLFTQGGPILPEYAAMMLQSQSKHVIPMNALMNRKLTDVIAMLPRVDFVVVQDPGMEGRPGFPIPGELWERDLKSYLDKNAEWQLVNTYSTVDKKNAYLYGKTAILKLEQGSKSSLQPKG